MKKLIISLFVSLFVVSGLGTEVFAAEEINPSPVYKPNTTIENVEPTRDKEGEDPQYITKIGDVTVILTPYDSRDALPSEKKTNIETAYTEVKSKPVSELDLVIPEGNEDWCGECFLPANLYISDVFDISDYIEGSVTTEETIEIPLTVNQINFFVCLLHYRTSDSKWEIVDRNSYSINSQTGILKFTAKYVKGTRVTQFSPFAIVLASKKNCPDGTSSSTSTPVSERGDYTAPKTGVIAAENDNNIWHLIAVAALAVTAVSSYIFVKKDNNKK